ncbi:MAG: hypothetical protein HRT38_02680 [Alteromonadaceae bacterium]|nr:hypothetical protein [Alteromonadaceae bacterium]
MHLLQLPKNYRSNVNYTRLKPRGEIEINPAFFKGCNYSVIHPNEGIFDGEIRRPYTKTVASETFYAKGFETSATHYTRTSLAKGFLLPEKGKTFIVYANLSDIDDWGEMVSYYSTSDEIGNNRHALSKNETGNLFLQINDSFQTDTGLKMVIGEPALYCGVVETSGNITLYQYSKSNSTETATGLGTSVTTTIKDVFIGNSSSLPKERSCSGTIYYSIVMDRAISSSEFNALSAKPYQIFSQKVYSHYFEVPNEVSITAVLPGIYSSGLVDQMLPLRNAAVTVDLPSIIATSNVIHGVHVVQLNTSATLPGITASAVQEMTAPLYRAIVGASLPWIIADIKVNIGALLSASLVLPAITAQVTSNYTLPMYGQKTTATIPAIQAVIRYNPELLGYIDIISFKEPHYKIRI